MADDGGVRERAEAYLRTFPARQSIRRRKAWIETIFGDGKQRRGLRRARCRGLDPMRIQAWMTATAQNVRQLALRTGTRPTDGAAALEQTRCARPPRRQQARNRALRPSMGRVRQQSRSWG